MPTLILAIVYGRDKHEALTRADYVFERLKQEHVITEYSLLGRRWAKLPIVAKVPSSEAKQFIAERWQATKKGFATAIAKVREGINRYSDDELFSNLVAVGGQQRMFRYWCSVVGGIGGTSIFIYDNDGEGIREEDHLANALSKWRFFYEEEGKVNPYHDKKVWVVPAQAQF